LRWFAYTPDHGFSPSSAHKGEVEGAIFFPDLGHDLVTGAAQRRHAL
jgi:hypothetical protein